MSLASLRRQRSRRPTAPAAAPRKRLSRLHRRLRQDFSAGRRSPRPSPRAAAIPPPTLKPVDKQAAAPKTDAEKSSSWSTSTAQIHPPPPPPVEGFPDAPGAPYAPPPEEFSNNEEGYTIDEIREASRGFFGTISTSLGEASSSMRSASRGGRRHTCSAPKAEAPSWPACAMARVRCTCAQAGPRRCTGTALRSATISAATARARSS